MTLPLTASIVVYRSPPNELAPLLRALASAELVQWAVVDNAASEQAQASKELETLVNHLQGLYIPAPSNLGFGAGHNLALKRLSDLPAEFHVLVNPDIEFAADVLPALVDAMRARPAAAMMMPRVIYPDGAFQPLCKLLPTPADFALRRFTPSWLQRMFQRRLDRYEMRGIENMECSHVPFLSGCFLFTRRHLLEGVGGFDKRYFLYMEDVDLCRRMATCGDLVYWPNVTVIHGCYRGAYRSMSLMLIFVRSAVRYFTWWGWIFDPERDKANRAALNFLSEHCPARQANAGKAQT